MAYPSDAPGAPSPQGDWRPGLPAPDDLGTVYFRPRPPLRKFQDRKWLHVVLFGLTLLTTTAAGFLDYLAYLSDFGRRDVRLEWNLLPTGLWYSLTILAILGAHEMGHYLMCRRYNVDASRPFFIPLWIPLPVPIQIGTLGAVIRIREPFPNKTVLFDIGVAGPIAGFLVLIPALFIGFALSDVVKVPSNMLLIDLGEPLLFKLGEFLMFGNVPAGSTVNMHPMVLAAWFGMLATALNLLPFGQLDGGHLTYATIPRFAAPISMVTVGTLIAMTYFTPTYFLFTVLMVVMVSLFGVNHPAVIHEDLPLPRNRFWVAGFALLMLIVCVCPVPMELILPNTPITGK